MAPRHLAAALAVEQSSLSTPMARALQTCMLLSASTEPFRLPESFYPGTRSMGRPRVLAEVEQSSPSTPMGRALRTCTLLQASMELLRLVDWSYQALRYTGRPGMVAVR